MIAASKCPFGVLMSGGLDSSILVARLLEEGHTVHPFYIASGLQWECQELTAIERFLAELDNVGQRPLVVLKMPLDDLYIGHWSVSGKDVPDARSADEAVFLPGRNAMLLVKAAVWCQLNQIPTLSLATLGTSPFGDASNDFISTFQLAINLGAASPVAIERPFSGLDKRQVMGLGAKYPLGVTFSCISPVGEIHCGVCNKCAERQAAFASIELDDPTLYAATESPSCMCD